MHSFVERSISNGPGARCVLWVQGCSLKCAGCFNPETHDFETGYNLSVEEVVTDITHCFETHEIQGLTISGGEPLQQFDAISELISIVKNSTDLSIVVFTGFSYSEVERMDSFEQLKNNVDVLICGRFEKNKRLGVGLKGSSNQTFHYFSDRYLESDFKDIACSEVIIGESGEVLVTGVNPPNLRSL